MKIHTRADNSTNRSLWGACANIYWILLFIVAFAVFLRFFGLANQSLWLDEAYQVKVSGSNSWSSIIQLCINTDTHPPLYYLLQHLWMILFGQSEAAVRSLSACLGIISVLLGYLVGRELFNRKIGLVASFLLAISHSAISMSQEVRPYSLLLTLTLLSFLFFIKILRADRATKTLTLFYVLSNLLLCYTHIYGIFMLGSQVLYFLLFRRTYPKAQLALGVSYVSTLIGLSPWIYVMFTSTFKQGIHGLDWLTEPTFGSVFLTLLWMAGAFGVAFVLYLFFAVAGILQFTLNQRKQRVGGLLQVTRHMNVKVSIMEPRTALLLTWFLFPLILSLVFSFAVRPIFYDRYLIGIIPAIYLLVAHGMDNISSTISSYTKQSKVVVLQAVVVLIAILAVPPLADYYTQPHKEQWREVVRFIESESKLTDVIVIYPDGYRTPFDYYYRGDPGMILDSQQVLGNDDATSTRYRLWLALIAAESDAPIKKELFSRYGNDTLILQKEFFAITVYLFDLPLKNGDLTPYN